MISKFSVRKPYTVLVGVVLAIVLGVVSFTKMTADLLPSISLPYVIVMTTYVGASPETVEMVVTKPIEASMATVSNIESISSISSENYSMVIMEFAQTANMDSISLEIRETLDQITSYWTDDLIGNPIIMKLNPDMMPVMVAAVGVDGMSVADVSTYAEDEIIPELESIEGVASVSATGLIEESVNVVIRQEKIDAINEQIRAAIDKQMEEAGQQLADGKKEVKDGISKINSGKKELVNGQAELDSGKADLASGKKELEDKQRETITQLADAQAKLLTAKADLETMKINTTVDIATLDGMIKGIAEIEAALQTSGTMITTLQNTITGLQSAYGTPAFQSIKDTFLANSPADLKKTLSALDWDTQFNEKVSGEADTETVCGILIGYIKTLQGLPDKKDALEAQAVSKYLIGESTYSKEKADKQLAALKGQLDGYNKNIAELDAQLVSFSKGEASAILGFASGSTQISLGESQLDSAQATLDAAKSDLKDAEQQLKDALSEIEDGEQQLADAKVDAYDKADMVDILTVDTISALLAAQNFSMPAGYVTDSGNSYMVRIGDKPSTTESIAAMPLMNLNMEGVDIITLGDVADVFYVDNSAEVYTNVNGSAGVILTVQKQTGYSTGAVSDLLLERFHEMMENNQDLTMIALMDQGIYIDLVMDSILSNIMWGALLAILILIIFLKDLRPTMVVAFSIPISLVTAIVLMYFSGVTLNIISLSGLALGIGMLVDNSIVVIENIYRLRGEGYSMKEAAIQGAKEVAGAIFASTLTTICVFAPIVFTEGITRQLFVDMGLTIAYSLLASLVIALTVVPAMASKVLSKTKEQKEGKIFGMLSRGYETVLGVALKVKPLVFILVIVLLGVSAAAAFSNGTSFMSDMDSTQMTVNVTLSKEATLEETGAVTDEVVARILEIEDIQDVGAMAGGSSMLGMLGGGSSSTNSTTIYVTTRDEKTMSNEEIADIIMEKTSDIEAEVTVNTSSMDMTALGGSGITIQIEGKDLDTLQRLAGEVAAVVASVEGTADVTDGMEETTEEVRITIDRDKAIEYGLTVAQVFQQVSSHLAEGSAATTLVTEEKDYSVYVISATDKALNIELLKDLDIEGQNADKETIDVPFSEIAEFEITKSLNSIHRADQTRYVSVSAGIAEGYNVGNVSTAVENKLADFELPSGYKLVFAGENEMINDALGQLVLMLVLALVFMYLIMVAQFQSLLSPFIIMFTIPLAFTGGLFGLFFTGSEISVIAMIGFIMLAGIIVNNGIVLIDYMNQLRAEGMDKKEAILNAGRTRLRPVLMTALTTILALSTMVFSKDMGAEMMKPMAIVTIGGLTYGTLLTLIVIPCIYDIVVRNKKSKED